MKMKESGEDGMEVYGDVREGERNNQALYKIANGAYIVVYIP